eukprot:CAMPEP_0115835546 /NCGR_PEP_ID=MMETSP0287-20121206/4248_1 /TAXON_ID=412157 /ORGANISM="Chrysochromulina rotalis, Strain UIO044" /LENGTH=153 /DNA_ID=CAMNT_0003289003 /DNA_START=154 /DNA_END=612 /DNA_ORIENTATION=+
MSRRRDASSRVKPTLGSSSGNDPLGAAARYHRSPPNASYLGSILSSPVSRQSSLRWLESALVWHHWWYQSHAPSTLGRQHGAAAESHATWTKERSEFVSQTLSSAQCKMPLPPCNRDKTRLVRLMQWHHQEDSILPLPAAQVHSLEHEVRVQT